MTDSLRTAKRLGRSALVLTLALGFVACDDDDDPITPGPSGPDVVDIAQTTPEISTLAQAIDVAGLEEELSGTNPELPVITVFAPSNSAFGQLPAGELDRLLLPANRAELVEMLSYHVLPFEFNSANIEAGTYTTLAGSRITIATSGGVTVNGASVTTPDIEAANGVIHIIDDVLLPPRPTVAATADDASSLTTLNTALEAASLSETLDGAGPFTVFAPTNAAFAALGDNTVAALLEDENLDLLSKVLGYHVVAGDDLYAGELSDGQTLTTVQGEDLTIAVSGGAVTVNGANVSTINIRASNGVIHLIDEVLTPAVNAVEKAILNDNTTTLAAAIQAADLETALSGAGPFTIFAPVNAAFAGLGSYTVDQLVNNPAILTEVLQYHVVAGEILEGALVDGPLTTLDGEDIVIDLSGAEPTVNGAVITTTDIQVENGVIHLIDEVLFPSLDIVEIATITEEASTVAAAVEAGDLVSTLTGPGPFTVFAPLSSAFSLSEAAALTDSANTTTIQEVLTFHVVAGTITSGDITDGLTVASVEGGDLVFDLTAAGTTVNGAKVVTFDIEAENGVIHFIDDVILEGLDIVDVAAISEGTETVSDAILASSLEAALRGMGPYTVFAPMSSVFSAVEEAALTDADFQTVIDRVLSAHVVSGSMIMEADITDGATVTTLEGLDLTFQVDLTGITVNGDIDLTVTDIVTENGVIHLINDVIIPEGLDVFETAVLNGSTQSVASLIVEAGLAATLQGAGPFTVFAPTNAAVDAFLAGLDTVPTQAELQDLLLYHVVAAEVLSTALTDGQVVTTENGDTFTVNVDAETGAVSITDGQGNTVNVTTADVDATNGVVHIIDGVLVPPTPAV